MSHEISATDQVFTVGEAAWHGLDHNRQGPRLTAEEAKTYLNWQVKKVPAMYEGNPVDGAFYTIRQDTDTVLGVVGSQYSIIQNNWLFKLLDPVVDAGECLYETGGSLKGGRKVWALAKLPGDYYIVNDDRVSNYILVVIAHDGSMMFTAMHTAIRVVCHNTLSAALSMDTGIHPIVRIKHTPGYNFQIQVAHKVLGLSTKASSKAATFFAEMAVKSMDSQQLTTFAKFVFPSTREVAGQEADARIQELRNKLYLGFDADINNMEPDKRHSAWSAYNAYTDILDHDKPGRKGIDRTDWSWFGPGQDKRIGALGWMKNFVGYKALPEPKDTYDQGEGYGG